MDTFASLARIFQIAEDFFLMDQLVNGIGDVDESVKHAALLLLLSLTRSIPLLMNNMTCGSHSSSRHSQMSSFLVGIGSLNTICKPILKVKMPLSITVLSFLSPRNVLCSNLFLDDV